MNKVKIGEMIERRLNSLVDDIRTELKAALAADLAGVLDPPGHPRTKGKGNGRPVVAAKKARAVKRWSPKTCIKPGCANAPNGPRYHYLCKSHQDAPKKDWEPWYKAVVKARDDAKK